VYKSQIRGSRQGFEEVRDMIPIDGFYLYSSGYQIHPLSEMKGNAPFQDWHIPLLIGQGAVETLLEKSIYQLKFSKAVGQKLLDAIKALTLDGDRTNDINMYEAYLVTSALSEFETVLTAELSQLNIFMVVKKRGYDTSDLVHKGWVLFPDEIVTKVPESLPDLGYAARCIAFELPTAAGFHMHRANESVLHHYYDAVTGGAARPTSRNIGDYLTALRTQGDQKILSALKDLKDLHRNPLIHPEHTLESVDEAIALLGSIQAAVVLMLREIPDPSKALPQSPP
jgi:hypothetical protein